MKKIGIKGLLLVALFLGVWFGFSQINWMKAFRVEQVGSKVSKELGDLYWKYFKGQDEEVCDSTVVQHVDSLLNRICTANGIDTATIKLHILSDSAINAFSLPDGHLVIYTGLLNVTRSDAQLCGVLCHEIAHLEKGHAMKKLIKEIGLASLLSNATGGNGDFMIKSIRTLTSTAYDRNLERKADAQAVQYMTKAGIDPDGLAQLLEQLDQLQASGIQIPTWISTHPDNAERIGAIRTLAKKRT